MEWEQDPGWRYVRLTREELAKEQTATHDAKKATWVPDAEEGFIAAEIKSTKGDMTTVITSKGNELTLKKDLLQEMNPPKFTKTEDMSNLSFLNDASVLWNLRDRYAAMLIYTYSGLFCVVINPYKRLPIYTDSMAKIYMGKRRNEVPPHLWAVSDEAYRNMLQDRENQSMLITGESGAGKTENTKKVIAYFAFLGAVQAQQKGIKADGGKKVTLEDQIVRTNPVLEAFGNAKTVRNNNSSRFGKFIRIHFSKDGRVAGCDIDHYLLEKSRVIRQAPGERCYHIFYQMLSGQDPSLAKKLDFDKTAKDYWYINQAETTIVGVDDKEEYQLTDESFDILNFTPEDKINCFKVASGIVHLGEMKFKQRPREEQAEPDGEDEAGRSANMFGVDVNAYLNGFCKPRVKVGTEWVNKGQNVEQVNWAKGAMAKGIYNRLFNWLVEKCNLTLDARELERVQWIGVLDIAGFEIFDFNSFEQLWINFVNEKLQQFFNHHMFVLEQEEYKREGIHWEFIDFGLDLQACIELIEKPLGIISMLDEECIVPKATDLTYAQKLNDQHLGKHPNFEKPKPPKGKQAQAHFAIKHYAGIVRYNVTNWLEKNKDPVNDTVVNVLKQSKANTLIAHIWADFETMEEAAAAQKKGGAKGGKKGKSASMMTVSMAYRTSLNNLMTMLNSTHPHFIRCIIPNEVKKSGLLDAALVMNQLTCNGVLEGIRICRKGFPNRTQHRDMRQRYAVLAADASKSSDDLKTAVSNMMQVIVNKKYLTEENFKVGHTKVFFKAGMLARLEDCRDEAIAKLMVSFQALLRWYWANADAGRRRQQLSGYTILQKNVRFWVNMRTWEWFKLYAAVRPLIDAGKKTDELKEMAKKAQEFEDALNKTEKERKALEDAKAALTQDKANLTSQLSDSQARAKEQEGRADKLEAQKKDVERQVQELNERCQDQEDKLEQTSRAKRSVETEREQLKRNVTDLEMSVRKAESEKQAKDHQIRSLQDEMAQVEANIQRMTKEKKQQEEVNRKLTEDLQAEEDKVNHLNKLKAKLESSLDEMENEIEKERRAKADLDKAKRKAEGELKVANETIAELERHKSETDAKLRQKDADYQSLSQRLEDEQALVAKTQRQAKDLQGRIAELEEAVEQEKQGRMRSERSKGELQREIDDLNDRLLNTHTMSESQIEANKKRDAEMAKIRRDLDEATLNHESQMTNLRKKHNDAVAEMGDQLEQLNKKKTLAEKDKSGLQRQLEEVQALYDQEMKQRGNYERMCKQLEMQVSDLQAKSDEQARQLQDAAHQRSRMTNEMAEVSRHLEDAEGQIQALGRLKGQLNTQLEEAKRQADEENRERQSMMAQCRGFQHELDQLRDQIDRETDAKSDLMRQLSKANSEVAEWRSRFESEGLMRAEEIEEARRKIQTRLVDMQDQLDVANQKVSSLEKMRSRLANEIDDAHAEIERTSSYAKALENKQKGFDRVLDEWKMKCDGLANELDASQRDGRNLATDVFKLRSQNDELHEQMDGLRRENKNMAQEVKDLTDQLTDGGRSVHELQKVVRRLEIEKEELQSALDDAESTIESQENKVHRAQVEVAQIRSEIEKRIHEKEEEFENTRKNHQRAIESMQASLETEARGRAELLRIKKKLESDLNELEIALDHANKANMDNVKNLRLAQDQIKDVQLQLEDEIRLKNDERDRFIAADRRANLLSTEKEQLLTDLDQAVRARKQAEFEAQESINTANELSAQNAQLSSHSRRIEAELHGMQSEIQEAYNELRAQEETTKKAMTDAARLADELRQEQEHSSHLERARKSLETQLRDMQNRLDEAEQAALKGGKKVIAKLEGRIRDLEVEIDNETRRNSEANKNIAKQERRIRELSFQVDEDSKNQARLQSLIENLQSKLKSSKRQVEEAEELATTNLQKYRQLQHQLEDAEERADLAENSLAKIRAKTRGGPGLMPSRSAAAMRSPSVTRHSMLDMPGNQEA